MEPDFPHRALGLGPQQPDDSIQLLKDYLTLTPHLLPQATMDPLNRPTIRHPELTPSNIFIDPSTGRVTYLIDWQHTVIQPRLLAAGYPSALKNPDMTYGPKLVEPQLPEDLATLPEEQQWQARGLYGRRLLFYCYRILTGGRNKSHHVALRDPMLLIRQMLVNYTGKQWTGNNVTLRGAVIRAVRFWKLLPDAKDKPCPIHFDDADLERFDELEERWINMSIMMDEYRRRVCNVSEDGWVRNENCEKAKVEIVKLKEEIW